MALRPYDILLAGAFGGPGADDLQVELTLYEQMQATNPWVLYNLYEWVETPAEVIGSSPREINTLYDMSGNSRDGDTDTTNEPDVDTSADAVVLAEPNPGDVLGGGNAAGTIETWVFNASACTRYSEDPAPAVTSFTVAVLTSGRRALNTGSQEFSFQADNDYRFGFETNISGGGRYIRWEPDGTNPNIANGPVIRGVPRGYQLNDADTDRGNTYYAYVISYKYDAAGSYWRIVQIGDGGVNGPEVHADTWYRDGWTGYEGPSVGLGWSSDPIRINTVGTWSGGLAGFWINSDAADPEDRDANLDLLKLIVQYAKTEANEDVSTLFDNSPEGISDLRSWWDFDDTGVALYDGSSYLERICDKGPDELHLVPDQGAGILGESHAIDFKTRWLPGPVPATGTTSFPEGTISDTISGDFSVMCVIPTDFGVATSGSVYFSMQGSSTIRFSIRASSTAGEIELADSSGRVAGIAAGFDASNADGAVAILFVRRDGVNLYLDCWYDDRQGGGVVKPTRVSTADTLGSMAVDNVSIGGDGTGNEWADTDAKLDSVAWWDRALTDAEVLALAQWAGERYALTGVA